MISDIYWGLQDVPEVFPYGMKNQFLKWIVTAVVLGIFYFAGEAGINWISSKDKVTDPLHKRVYYLLLLLCYAGIVMTIVWFIFKYIG